MAKYGAPWFIRRMKHGKFAVFEGDDRGRVVLDGLTKSQAERLAEYLVEQLANQMKVDKMAAEGGESRFI